MNIGPLKWNNLILNCHGKSKGDKSSAIKFPEDATYV